MKRLAVLLALVMTVGLVGCGNSGTQSKTESKNDTKEEATTEEAFEGEYIVNADYVKEHLDVLFLLMPEVRMPLIKRQSKEQFRLHGSIWLHVRTENQEMRIGDASLIQSV